MGPRSIDTTLPPSTPTVAGNVPLGVTTRLLNTKYLVWFPSRPQGSGRGWPAVVPEEKMRWDASEKPTTRT